MKHLVTLALFFIFFIISFFSLSAQNPCDDNDIKGFLLQEQINVTLSKKVVEMMRSYCPLTGEYANYQINSCKQFTNCDIPGKDPDYVCTVMKVTFTWSGRTCWAASSYTNFKLTALLYFAGAKITKMPNDYITRSDSFDWAEACSEVTKSVIQILTEGN